MSRPLLIERVVRVVRPKASRPRVRRPPPAPRRRRVAGRALFAPARLTFAGAVLATAAAGGCGPARTPSMDALPEGVRGQAPIVLVSVDTLRADHLPLYGYRLGRTPAIDSLAAGALVFERAFTHAPTTLPAHASLLTARLPGEHGVRDNYGYALAPGTPTLASVLAGAGYRTAAFVSAYPLRAGTGLEAGFDLYDDEFEVVPGAGIGEIQRSGAATVDRALAWLQRQPDGAFFLFVHLYEPHAPYTPPPPYDAGFASSYDGEIAAADEQVGRILEALARRGLYEQATVVFLADHGESLGEHGEEEHGVFLYASVLHVPLVIKLPAALVAGGGVALPVRVDAPVGLVDVAPTVLAIVGAGTLPGDGRKLLPASSIPARSLYAETFVPRLHFGWSELSSLIEYPYHYIEAPDPELYDLRADPGETRNLWARQPRRAQQMRERLAAFVAPVMAPAELGRQVRDRLAALGYVGTGAAPAQGEPLPDPKSQIHLLRHLKVAARFFFEERYPEAIAEYRAALDENPGMAAAWEFLGRAQQHSGDPASAATSFLRLAELTGRPDAYLHWGEALLAAGDLPGAHAAAEAAERAGAGSARVLRARIALAGGELDRAEELLSEELRARPDSLAARYWLATTWLSAGRRLDEAAELVAQVPVRDPRLRARIELLRGRILLSQGKPAPATAALRAAADAAPEQIEAWGYLAVAYYVAGDADRGERALEGMAAANPGPQALAMAVDVLTRLGRKADAARWRARAAGAGGVAPPPPPLVNRRGGR